MWGASDLIAGPVECHFVHTADSVGGSAPGSAPRAAAAQTLFPFLLEDICVALELGDVLCARIYLYGICGRGSR